jgi:hypothetical protein
MLFSTQRIKIFLKTSIKAILKAISKSKKVSQKQKSDLIVSHNEILNQLLLKSSN